MPKRLTTHTAPTVLGVRMAGDHARLRAAVRSRGAHYLALSPMRAQRHEDWDHALLRAPLRIFTSPTAVRAVLACGAPLHPQGPVLVVGEGSASLLRRAGFEHVEVAQSANIASLLSHDRLKRAHRIAVFTAPDGRGDWSVLRRRGHDISIAHVYSRQAVALRARAVQELSALRGPLRVVVSSQALMQAMFSVLSEGLQAKLRAAEWVVSSTSLAKSARALGVREVHIAAGPQPTMLARCALGGNPSD